MSFRFFWMSFRSSLDFFLKAWFFLILVMLDYAGQRKTRNIGRTPTPIYHQQNTTHLKLASNFQNFQIGICNNISHLDMLILLLALEEEYGLVWCVKYGISGMLVGMTTEWLEVGEIVENGLGCLWLRCANLHSHPDPESFVDIWNLLLIFSNISKFFTPSTLFNRK